MTAKALDDHLDFAKTFFAEQVAKTTEERGVPAMALFLDREGKLSLVAIDNAYMENGATKDNLAQMLRAQARKCEAVAMIFVTEAWLQSRTPEEHTARGGGSIAGQPDSKSTLVVQELRGGEVFMHVAEIIDTPGQPRALGEWRRNDYGRVEGRFFDAVLPMTKANYSRYVN